jgi:hypothetical protein
MKITITLNLEPMAIAGEGDPILYHPAVAIGTMDAIGVWWDVSYPNEYDAIQRAARSISAATSAAQAIVDGWELDELK